MFKYYSLRNSLYVLCVFFLINSTNGSIFDYFPIAKSLFTQNENGNSELEIQKVPYEVEVTDEKFIEQAAKFTGVSLSDLDRCQHRVVYKLQTECHKLNDEELAKLAVKLLNCQSAIEGRTIYPCTDQMPIRDCTSSMDPDTWNSYLLMSNRARAVCYSIRQAQFRGLTEMTVNKLMGAAHEQLGIMTRLSTSQTQLESATAEALDRVTADTSALREQQRDLQRAQLHGQLTLEDNIRRLTDEKQLIIDGHEQLAKMTKQVQDKLNEASEQLDSQAEERRDNHKEILNDLIEIQKQAQEIFSRIEQSSRQLLTSTELASIQYSSTLSTLSQINATISALSVHMSALNATVSSQLSWLMDGVGGTGLAISSLVQHAAWLLLAMLACSFLQLGPAARLAVLAIPPLNLVCTSYGLSAMNIQGVAGATLACVVAEALLNFALRFRYKKQPLALKQPISSPIIVQDNTPPSSRKGSNDDDDPVEQPQSPYDSPVNSTFSNSFTYTRGNYSNSNTYRRFDVEDSGRESPAEFDFQSPTPPLSRQGRSRSKTPAMNGTERHRCGANTRLGTPCKSLALLGRDYCYRHQTGSSVIGE